MIKDFGPIYQNGTSNIILTPDSEWLFATCKEGQLKQYSQRSQKLIQDYGIIHGKKIGELQITKDSKWLITSAENNVYRISVDNRQVDKDFGQVFDNRGITAMKLTVDSKKLLVGDWSGFMKLISAIDGELIKDFGRAHSGMITEILITVDHKYFFTSSLDECLKQWNYKNNTLYKAHRNLITDGISSIC